MDERVLLLDPSSLPDGEQIGGVKDAASDAVIVRHFFEGHPGGRFFCPHPCPIRTPFRPPATSG
jgi:hypothetical protein